MWHEPPQQSPKCAVLQQSSKQRGPAEGSSRLPFARRCAPQSPSRRPFLHFPPPPKHPPPHSVNPRMSEDHLLSVPGPSSARQPHEPSWEVPNDYSYAYYEPGPAKKHTNIPNKYPGGAPRDGAYREGSYRAKHTYLTRYGTEENIYEEISEVTRARMHAAAQHQQSIISLNQSLVEEEVRRVQSGHRRVLGELNLSVEAMLMPNSREGSDDTDRETDDQLADLLSVGPTDELLSPIPPVDLDSGFSGSSSGASYRSAAGSLRRGPPDRNKCCNAATSKTLPSDGTPSKSFWNRKAWKKLAGFSSNVNVNKQQETNRVHFWGKCKFEPIRRSTAIQ
ncbi:hypothetical protein PPYR_11879 [Photinus pyralis]|uniref:Uncharacterized protein n=1 Tax=Photinus pyralis TaxID=7054 RepID=A0A5N4ACI9_PHOPY|nr:uncharacterized protein LOC116177400 isoform X2 [Photinus pyralis]KAB0795040.1 hypothetical protein PPYR_11879 [Photinus pyralis]